MQADHTPRDPRSASSARRLRLGKYQITDTLRNGAMGMVYKGFDPVIHRSVALKTISNKFDDESAAARFLKEAQAAGSLTHPGIATVYDYGEDDGVAFIAMELIEGQPLDLYLPKHRPLPEQEVVSIVAQLLDALEHAHSFGLTHRDVKLANIIRLSDGRIKLIDFGLVRTHDSELTQLNTQLGTPIYMAPELWMGLTANAITDVYACGVTLYYLLTGGPPFDGSLQQVQYRAIHEAHVPPSQVPGSVCSVLWDSIVAVALAKKPDDRYPSAVEFKRAIRELIDIPQPQAQAKACAELPEAPGRQRPWAAWGIGFAAGVAAAGALVLAVNAGQWLAQPTAIGHQSARLTTVTGLWQGQALCDAPIENSPTVLPLTLPPTLLANVEVVDTSVFIELDQGNVIHKLYAVLDSSAGFDAKGMVRSTSSPTALQALGHIDRGSDPARMSAQIGVIRLADGRQIQTCRFSALWQVPR